MAHYDYWSDKLKRSVLLDSGADLISYGMGEKSIVEIADALNLGGKTNEEKLENLIKALNELKEKIGIKKCIKDYGVDEKVFLETLDEMSEAAFDDQCTGTNPRYPLISEIKEMYLRAYYGK